MKECFRRALPEDVPAIWGMIRDRVRWMDEKGLRHWNVTDYLNIYPLAYYQRILDSLYVLTEGESGRILSAGALFEQDDRWQRAGAALYVHHLVSRTDAPGAGSRFLKEAEELAAATGKEYLRLDSSDDNPALTQWYTSRGFVPVGTCADGSYHGILREKKIK